MIFPKRNPVDEVVEKLLKLNDWYSAYSSKANLSQLSDARDQITTLLSTLGTYVGDSKEDELTTERVRKFKFSTKRLEYKLNSCTINEAEDRSTIDTLPEKELADKSSSYYVHLRLLLERMDKVDDAISQRISIQKKEKEKANA
jgi:hypothetical protein